MSLAKYAVEKSTITWFTLLLLIVGGIGAYFGLGQLEDPEFTVKTAVVTTPYPGASAEEVELEVTDRIEQAVQELPQLDYVHSLSRPGLSIISVNIRSEFWADVLPQVWDELRKKVGDVKAALPPGAGEPEVSDDFGDVFGFFMAVTGDGFSYAELESAVDDLKKELGLVEGVARVDLWGVQTQCIYVDVSSSQLATLGIGSGEIERTLSQQNMVVDAGAVDVDVERLRISPTGEFQTPEDIGDLTIRGRSVSAGGATDELIRIRDIGTVRRGYVEPPVWEMRYNGEPALGISVANRAGVNIVDLGQAIDMRLGELVADMPIGLEVHKIAWQSDLVQESIVNFMISLLEAVAIVLVVLAVAMGLRMAVIIGFGGLVFVIIGSFLVMSMWGIDLQRMSLGALVIAMGMMVDNAIVVADGIVVRMQRGMGRVEAAVNAASQPSMPLLGATFVAVMAFYPIFASSQDSGEYCRSLFQVVAIALLLSWILSVTVIPLMCIALLPAPKASSGEADAYGGRLYRTFRGVLEAAIKRRWFFLGGMTAMLLLSVYGFGHVKQMFFPDSSRLQFMIDYWAPEGTRIQQVSADLRDIERNIAGRAGVESVSTFVGQGPARFYLPVDPEMPYESYAQLIVNTETLGDVHRLADDIEAWMASDVPQALVRVRKYGVGPSDTWKFEARFSGPAIADKDVLRELSQEGVRILEDSPFAKEVRTDWRQRTKKIVPVYDANRGRWTNVTRPDVARATRRAYDGFTVGQFRERDKLLPIILRHTEPERSEFVAGMDVLQVRAGAAGAGMSTDSVPLSQVTAGIDMDWEDPIIWRYNRRRAITVQCSPDDVTAPTLRADVLADFENIELPSGYELMWDGEYKSTVDGQAGLIPGIVPAFLVVALIVVALFNAYRPPLIILCTIPFAAIGITFGLLITGAAFGFLALLGAMSLSGMMIKNAIVLLDQINLERADGKGIYQAIVDSALSRLRPVVLAAATTVLGVIPLLQDVFWVSMAVTIMFGLAFGTLLTMVLIPVLYACFFRVPVPEEGS